MMCYFTEIRCRDWTGDWYGYFYTIARRPIRKLQDINSFYIPDGLRLIIYDYSWEPVEVNSNLSIFQYIYRKYFKKSFRFGYRVNWEKELKKEKRK